MALTKLTGNLIEGGVGMEWDATVQTSNFTAVSEKGYFVNTTSNEITVSLPAGTVGAQVVLQDYAGTFGTNKVIISANGSDKIQGTTSDFQCTTNYSKILLIYQNATRGWTADNITVLPLTVEWLVVAGGGAGGGNSWVSGGGGAGGLRTSYGTTSGGGASAENDIIASSGDSFTVTIGAGGAGATTKGSNGNDSTFSTITSLGGGGGGGSYNSSQVNGLAGGSGGGAGGATYWSGSGGSGTVNQGYAGGSSSSVTGCGVGTCQAAGGGGAAGTGASNVTATDNTTSAGAGLVMDITGSNVTYAYGGRGLQLTTGFTAGGGTTNTGNGGWGAYHDPTGVWGNPTNVSGAAGIVILRYPSGGSLTLSAGLTGSTTTVGSSKVTSITAGTGTVTFA